MAEESRAAMMRRLYHDERCSIEELSAHFGVTRGDVRSWMMSAPAPCWSLADPSQLAHTISVQVPA